MAENLHRMLRELGGELITVGGVNVIALMDFNGAVVGDAIVTEVSALLVPADVPTVGQGTSVVARGLTYKVRLPLPEPPDGALLRLVLAKV